jgi:hypothetical protein
MRRAGYKALFQRQIGTSNQIDPNTASFWDKSNFFDHSGRSFRTLLAPRGENKSLYHLEIERSFTDQLTPIDRNTL